MKLLRIVSSFALLATISCQEVEESPFATGCPEPNGFFADSVQCDKYYACVDGVLSVKYCQDGLVFNDFNQNMAECDFPFRISCKDRPTFQDPSPSENCPRANGYFAHPNSLVCNKFYFCSKGKGFNMTCPEGLVFSEITGTCVWPDESGRTDCSSGKTINFICPTTLYDRNARFFSDPEDCQYFYYCFDGKTPRRKGCKFGQVFNDDKKECDKPINVPECKEYYFKFFEDHFANLTTYSDVSTPDIIEAAMDSGFEIPEKPKRVQYGNRFEEELPEDFALPELTTTSTIEEDEQQQVDVLQDLEKQVDDLQAPEEQVDILQTTEEPSLIANKVIIPDKRDFPLNKLDLKKAVEK